MAAAEKMFESERDGDVLLVTPTGDLHELDYPDVAAAAKDVLGLLKGGDVRHVILDFRETDYFGSTALGFFVQLWNRVRRRQGNMAFCNLSDAEKEILKVTKLDDLWPICPSREEALKAVRAPEGA
ncbi:MAG TPA: STAS domain-containing protein [Gemmataceae bacterium]